MPLRHGLQELSWLSGPKQVQREGGGLDDKSQTQVQLLFPLFGLMTPSQQGPLFEKSLELPLHVYCQSDLYMKVDIVLVKKKKKARN